MKTITKNSIKRDKILITGAQGHLGQALVGSLKEDFQVVPTTRETLDFTDKKQTEKTISLEKPDLIIHSGAWTDVDGCAKDPEKAMFVNGEGTKNLALATQKVGAKLIYISTNEVFDGKKTEPYLETDIPNPITAYGKSKRLGETYVEEILKEDSTVVRLSWLFGPTFKNSFPHKMIDLAKRQGFLKVVEDEISTPTYIPDVAGAVKELISKEASGVFHIVNSGIVSRYDWARQVFSFLKIDTTLKPIKARDFQRISKPPLFTPLSNLKAKSLGIHLRDWKEASEEYLSHLAI